MDSATGEAALNFLNRNSGAITAIAALAGVVIAALYTLYTTRLWKVSVQQARSADIQAESSKRQLELIEQQMSAAQKAFDSVHRPHLRLSAQMEPINSGKFKDVLYVLAKNYGAAGTMVTGADCRVRCGDGEVWKDAVWVGRFLPIEIPPGESERIGGAFLPEPADGGAAATRGDYQAAMSWVHIHVTYSGLGDSTYPVSSQVCLLPDSEDRTRWTLVSVTPTGREFWDIHGKKGIASVSKGG